MCIGRGSRGVAKCFLVFPPRRFYYRDRLSYRWTNGDDIYVSRNKTELVLLVVFKYDAPAGAFSPPGNGVRGDSTKNDRAILSRTEGFAIVSDRTLESTSNVAISDSHLLLASFSGHFFFVFRQSCAQRTRLEIINVSRKMQWHFRGDILNHASTCSPRGNMECIVLSVAISWRYRAGVSVFYFLVLQSSAFCLCHLLKPSSLDIDQFYFKSYSISSSLHIGKATRCPMNFIETKIHTYMHIWNANSFILFDMTLCFFYILTQNFYVSLLKCCFGRMRFRVARNFSLARIYVYFQNFFQHRDYRKFHPRCNFDS